MGKPHALLLTAAVLFLATGIGRAGESPESELLAIPLVSLCDALEAVEIGDRFPISVTGAYKDGLLFDPLEKVCSRDVQPVTLIEWSSQVGNEAELMGLAEKHGQAIATFTGILWGEERPELDDLRMPASVAYANRVGGLRRYGPHQRMRTKLVVEKVEEIRAPQPFADPPPRRLSARSPLPVVERASMSNLYPRKARQAHVSGDVRVEVTVRGGKVSTTILSGDRLLADDAIANLATWVFAPDAEGTFTTTFSYRFDDLPSTTASVRIRTELPHRVEIIAPLDAW